MLARPPSLLSTLSLSSFIAKVWPPIAYGIATQYAKYAASAMTVATNQRTPPIAPALVSNCQ
jgi:hypothetical protein